MPLRLIWRCPADVVEQAVKAVFRDKDGDIIGALRAEAAAYPHLLPFLGAAEAFYADGAEGKTPPPVGMLAG